LPGRKSRLQSVAWNGAAALAARLLSGLAGVREPGMDWRLTHEEPFFDNQVATLELDGPAATITFKGAVLDADQEPTLRTLYRRRLA
ncbi:MAG TPA: alkaline phosphatase family protein, partial [Rubrobacter sp.]|nr:alkaline phosphatase family protein [Rubrobacter sp.]